jgi:hypothetical protein
MAEITIYIGLVLFLSVWARRLMYSVALAQRDWEKLKKYPIGLVGAQAKI